MDWASVLLALLVSHVVGDVLLQTERQAIGKAGGLRTASGREALGRHVAGYMVAFVPTLVWIGDHASPARAVLVGVTVAIPHLLIDDGRLVRAWVHRVKGAGAPGQGLLIAVDQSFHLLCLLGAALLAAA